MFHAGEWVSSLTSPLIVTREWDFVNITDPKQRKDKKLQRLVRVKAQKHVRKCQRQEQDAKPVSPESKPPSEAASARETPFPLGQLTLCDPGMPSSYPVPMKPYMQALLDRCQYTPVICMSQRALSCFRAPMAGKEPIQMADYRCCKQSYMQILAPLRTLFQ